MLLPLCSFGHQPEGQRKQQEPWMAQKIAYLTEVMDLTTEEAQVFWPIYNQAQKEKREAYKAVKQAYANLDKGIQEGKGKKEIKDLLRQYTAALEATQSIDSKYVTQYERVLPVEKVAKLFIGEETFRRQQIQRLGKK
jgi:phage terminase Nu1 subunit (DNA packaging protein)